VLVLLLALSVAPVVFLGGKWKEKAERHGQEPAEPFRIAGNFYYVGANDTAAFLITGPEGHVVLDAGYPTTAPMIMASIAKLGFDIKHVKVLLNSNPRPDHAGGLSALQQASGAELWASDASADVIAAGGDDPDIAMPLRTLVQTGSSATRPRASTTVSRTATRSVSGRSRSPRTSPAVARAAAPRGRSPFATVTAR
jgi:metallo-beta-lactamase class B